MAVAVRPCYHTCSHPTGSGQGGHRGHKSRRRVSESEAAEKVREAARSPALPAAQCILLQHSRESISSAAPDIAVHLQFQSLHNSFRTVGKATAQGVAHHGTACCCVQCFVPCVACPGNSHNKKSWSSDRFQLHSFITCTDELGLHLMAAVMGLLHVTSQPFATLFVANCICDASDIATRIH
jgi:hypothetical protein